MSLKKRMFLCLMLGLLLLLTPALAFANSAEPPGLIIAVASAPEDLMISLCFADEKQLITLGGEKKAWVTYYRFFYHTMIEMGVDHDKSVEDTVLIANTGGNVMEFDLPDGTFQRYNNLLELDLQEGTLILGQNPWRVPMLVALRVVLTLVIEGAVFFLFGYRKARTWIAFLICNLLTQTALNVMITGPQLGYWQIVYVLMEVLIFISESVALGVIVKENKAWVTVLCVILANALSLVLGGVLITYLPV